jgi:hypothetical protein
MEYRLCKNKNILYYISYIIHLNAASRTHILLVYSRPGLGKCGRSYTKNELTEKGREYIVSAWSTRVVYSHVGLNYIYAFLFTFVIIYNVLCQVMCLLISRLSILKLELHVLKAATTTAAFWNVRWCSLINIVDPGFLSIFVFSPWR